MVTCCKAWIAKGAPPAPCAAEDEAGKAQVQVGSPRRAGRVWVAVFRMPLMPPALKKNCVPYCRLSFNVTSAMTASMRTCSGNDVDFPQHRLDRAELAVGAIYQDRVVLVVGNNRAVVRSLVSDPPGSSPPSRGFAPPAVVARPGGLLPGDRCRTGRAGLAGAGLAKTALAAAKLAGG